MLTLGHGCSAACSHVRVRSSVVRTDIAQAPRARAGTAALRRAVQRKATVKVLVHVDHVAALLAPQHEQLLYLDPCLGLDA